MANIPEFRGTISCKLSSSAAVKSSETKNNYYTKVDKKSRQEEAERKRVQSLQRQRESYSQRKKIISGALKAVDQPTLQFPVNKRVKFSSSSSSDEEESVLLSHEKPRPKDNRNQLFDDDEEEDVKLDFNGSKYNGERGTKLLELQSKYGSVDKRFRLDERFLDDVQSNSQSAVEVEEDAAVQEELNSNMRVLEKILGKPLAKAESPSKKSKNTPYLRYDPENPAHRHLQVSSDEEEALNDEDGKDNDVTESLPLLKEPMKEGNFDEEEEEEKAPVGLDPEFASRLRREQFSIPSTDIEKEEPSSGFSLRKQFGCELGLDKDYVQETSTEAPFAVPSWIQDQRWSEDEEKETEQGDGYQDSKLITPADSARQLFFVYDETKDERILDGEKFRRMEDLEAVRAKWQRQRFGLIKFYKGRRKEALKKLKQREAVQDLKRPVAKQTLLIPRVLMNCRPKTQMIAENGKRL